MFFTTDKDLNKKGNVTTHNDTFMCTVMCTVDSFLYIQCFVNLQIILVKGKFQLVWGKMDQAKQL